MAVAELLDEGVIEYLDADETDLVRLGSGTASGSAAAGAETIEACADALLDSLRAAGGSSTVSTILGAAVTIGAMTDDDGRIALDLLAERGRIHRTGEGNEAWLQIAADPAQVLRAKDAVTDTLLDEGGTATIGAVHDRIEAWGDELPGGAIGSLEVAVAIGEMQADGQLTREGPGGTREAVLAIEIGAYSRPWQGVAAERAAAAAYAAA